MPYAPIDQLTRTDIPTVADIAVHPQHSFLGYLLGLVQCVANAYHRPGP